MYASKHLFKWSTLLQYKKQYNKKPNKKLLKTETKLIKSCLIHTNYRIN